jgi:hypothetical protein
MPGPLNNSSVQILASKTTVADPALAEPRIMGRVSRGNVGQPFAGSEFTRVSLKIVGMTKSGWLRVSREPNYNNSAPKLGAGKEEAP